ncbi:protein HUA2-LIKE 2 isoform X3 [Manihot esculenta]|uniref:protein HUA2-LIKE 2 isoform X3 n=1 Tax=Manihot esculenta TaxID=3983 RepID=UPI001CC7CC6B|nr:protein HUA2-LIKE 2 isoform X3 [Manihot esculenta]
MGPNRRRGAGKAAAAAAARRQWKVGDLVLAKVKGFPAWPATVSEPEKWGYPADWKKVLVYFFGTQQIAFCNPADVEAFTEEKKQSLLVKRQGKGADFVRAVQEIIDSYEKSKKPDQFDDLNSGNEVTLVNGGNSMESSANFELKDQTETSEVTVTVRRDTSLASSVAPDVAKVGSLHDEEASLQQPDDNLAATAKPVITTYTSRKRSGGLRSRKRATQKKDSSVERSIRLVSSRFQNFIMPSNDCKQSAVDASTEVILNRSLRRNKRFRKSPCASELDDVDSSAFVSNGSVEDDGSEIVTVDSDSLSLNEGSTVDSACKPEHSETDVDGLEADIELSKGLDFQIKAVFIKKKRKPNRKRVTNEANERPARLETEADLDAGVPGSSQNSQWACENLSERHNKDDGDEHLPLVKRARVRMGKLSSLEDHSVFSHGEEKTSDEFAVNFAEAHNGLCQVEERTSGEVAVTTLEHIGPPCKFQDDCSADKGSFSVKEALDHASPQKGCAQTLGNRPLLSIAKEHQSLGCSADGEAALPPSKRLHRALEAMSANAAEEGQACADISTLKTSINDSLCKSINRKRSNCAREQSIESPGCRASALCSSSNRVLEEAIKAPLKADICNQPTESSDSQEHYEGVLTEALDHDLGRSCVEGDTISITIQQNAKDSMPNFDRREGTLQSNHGSFDQLFLLKDEIGSENIESRDVGDENHNKDVLEHSQMSPSLITQVDETAKGSSENGSNVFPYSAEDTGCENTESLRSLADGDNQVNGVCEEAKVEYEKKQEKTNYASISNDHLNERASHSSPMPADGVELLAQTSPPTTSTCHVSTSESANFIQNSQCSSPNRCHQKTVCTSINEEKMESVAVLQHTKSVGKWSNYAEAQAVLSSFERMLGSLTRTKESIGRATRIAIDCAKFGLSTKVVEILTHNLENESSLHRRVDLFFLVDSITQCSRALKGDVGGIYPSAIQSVLTRLLSAAAPPGSFALENRRQCLKVLRLWLERKILPESVIRHHMRELDALGGSSSAGAYSRRSARTERALDDPVRDMEGMLVDEYGSNSSFQLPGFCMPRMLKDEDEGSDSDGESFEAVTPEHNYETPEELETTPAAEKHTHILEDVDGELEMEDVAPSCEVETSSTGGTAVVNSSGHLQNQLEQHFPLPFAPPLPQDVPPSSPPLPTSPPPPPPPPPPLAAPQSCGMPDPYVDSKFYANSHNMHDDARESVDQQPEAPRMNPSISNGVHYHGPECRDQMQMQQFDSNSFNSYSVPPVHTDGPNFHHKAYPPRPPHPPTSNHFSYVQAGQHVKSRRETPPPYHHRFHSSHSADGGNFYNNHDRMRPVPYEMNDGWRYPAPPFPGPRHPDKSRASHPPGPYGGPPREPNRIPHQEWSFPPRGTHHRNFMPFRPPPERAIPVSNRESIFLPGFSAC